MRGIPIPDTFWTTQEELALFGGSVLMGIPAGILFDGFRLFRRCIRHPALAVAVEDILWLLGVSVLLLCYASACARGVFRAYYAAGCLLGFLLYEVTLGEPAVKLLDLLRKMLCVPLRWVRCGLASICTKMQGRFVRISQICKCRQEIHRKRLQAYRKMVYNKKRHKQKGNPYGKSKTFGQPPAVRHHDSDPQRTRAGHRSMCNRIHQYAEFHRGKTKGTCRTERPD